LPPPPTLGVRAVIDPGHRRVLLDLDCRAKTASLTRYLRDAGKRTDHRNGARRLIDRVVGLSWALTIT
jgi:hypothetical protein